MNKMLKALSVDLSSARLRNIRHIDESFLDDVNDRLEQIGRYVGPKLGSAAENFGDSAQRFGKKITKATGVKVFKRFGSKLEDLGDDALNGLTGERLTKSRAINTGAAAAGAGLLALKKAFGSRPKTTININK